MRRSKAGSLALSAAMIAVTTPSLAATVKGTVRVAVPPTAMRAHVVVDGHVCGAREAVYARRVEIEEGGLKDVILFVEGAEKKALPPPQKIRPPLVIDQINCSFVPRVAAIPVGTEVRFKNSDPVLHNVHAIRPGKGSVANFSLPLRGQEVKAFVADQPGEIQLRCDAGHDWMRADIRVFDHGVFAVSGAGGAFELGGLRPGKYVLVAWHPDLGSKTLPFEIDGDRDQLVLRVDF